MTKKKTHFQNRAERRAKEFGYKNTHHLIEEKIVPEPIKLLARLLAQPENEALRDKAIKGKDFSECLAIIAAEYDVALDGSYSPEDIVKICDILCTAISVGKTKVPHTYAKELQNVELVERSSEISLEEVGGAIGTITGDPTRSSVGGPYTVCDSCITSFNCCKERSCSLGTPAVQLGETKQKLEQVRRSMN